LGIDNLSTGKTSNIDKFLKNPKFKFVNKDLLEYLPSSYDEFDEIFHLASPASPPKYMSLPMQTMKVNTLGTELLCELAIKTGARILFASTSEIYGDPLVHPQHESYFGNVNTLGPRSVYDEAKRFGETLLSHFNQSRGANVVIVRIFNTYGPQMDPFDGRVVSTFLRQALRHEPLTIYGTGNQTRSFCYVSDLILGLELAMASKSLGPFNLGNPSEFSIIELIGQIEKLVGSKLNYKFLDLPVDDPKVRCPDITLAKQILGWNPKIGIENGLQLTLDWMKQNISLR
jgi:nucleoside-diphosphate-sugar epimerase